MKDKDSLDERLPPDLPGRLELLRSLTGLSWVGFARSMGVRHERVVRWRTGARPNDHGIAALCNLAARIPGGADALFGDGTRECGGEA